MRLRISVVTQQACTYCDMAKTVLEKLSREYPLTMSIVPIETPEGATLVERGGVVFPPGVFIDGQPFSYGRLSERKIRREIERRLDEVGKHAEPAER